MNRQTLACSGCGRQLPVDPAELAALNQCPHCSARMQVAIFPAYSNSLHPLASQPSTERPVILPGESSCYFHPTRPATVACDRCGRLVCTLCDLPAGPDHLCPDCLPVLDSQGRVEAFERQRIRYDLIVWLLLLLGILSLGTTMPLTGSVALGLALWKRRAPPSRVDRTRVRMLVAIPLAAAEIGFGLWIWTMIVY